MKSRATPNQEPATAPVFRVETSTRRLGRPARGLGHGLVLALGFLMTVVSSSAVLGDEVILVPGSTVKQAIGGRVRGQIQTESPTEVVVQVGAGPVSVPVEQIASIRYDGQSASFQIAESRQTGGQLLEAIDLFHKAVGESTDKPLPLRAALVREALALTELALIEPDRAKDALDKLKAYIQKYPNSRQITLARDALVRLQLHTGDYAGAASTIAEIAKIPAAAERATVLKTKLLAKQGKFREAQGELDSLIAAAPKGSARRGAAVLAKAECMAGLKDYKLAESLAREVILESPPEDAEAQAPAYNTLGDCLRAANRPKDALLAYLHTDLLYGKDRVEHPRALHQIEVLFRQLKQDSRADEFAQRLKQEYPKSPWVSAKPDH